MIKEITSPANPKVKFAASLKLPKSRKENKLFLCEGIKSLELALKANLVKEIFTLKQLKDIPANIDQYIVSEEVINKIAFSTNPEGVVFICNYLENKAPKKLNKVVYLDHINDPGNMGTIIRTALAFSYDAIVLSKDCVSIYNEKTIAASKGAMFLMPIFEKEISEFDLTYKVIVSTLNEKSIELNHVAKPQKFVLVLGNEAHGVSQDSIDRADVMVKIPVDNIDSLNVSVAAGILMNYLR